MFVREHFLIPAPKVLFKYVYDSENDEGIVFLTANNPYVKPKRLRDYVICEPYDPCIQELGDEILVIEHGYTYCCTVGEFLKNEEVQKILLPDFSDVEPLINP